MPRGPTLRPIRCVWGVGGGERRGGIEGARKRFEGEEKIEEVKRDFEWEGRVTEEGGWMTEEMGVEVLLLLWYVAALVAAVAPTERICTGIYPAR